MGRSELAGVSATVRTYRSITHRGSKGNLKRHVRPRPTGFDRTPNRCSHLHEHETPDCEQSSPHQTESPGSAVNNSVTSPEPISDQPAVVLRAGGHYGPRSSSQSGPSASTDGQ